MLSRPETSAIKRSFSYTAAMTWNRQVMAMRIFSSVLTFSIVKYR